jgi:NodT family efflux transporter outer membrane factor (OMF) lipoprotein
VRASGQWSCLCAALLAGCQALTAQRTEPASAGVAPTAGWSTPGHAGPLVQDWVADLGDPRLEALVAEAAGSNFDLHAAAARLDAALARADLEAASARPRVDASGNASRRGSGTERGARVYSNSFDARFDAAWEADLWGRLSDATQAAALEARASAADLRAARLSVAADVAGAWFDAVEAALQLDLAEETLRNFEDNLEIVESGFRAGLNSALDVRLERANLAGARSRVEARHVDSDRAVRALEVLLGRYPGAALAPGAELPALSVPVPAGLPAELLERRPDVRAAGLRLEASDRRVDEARKARLPALRLTGAGGFGSTELRDLLDFDSLLWSLAAGLLAPVVDGGRIDARVAIERARTDEALADYARVLLTAFREVETTLASEAYLQRQEAALREASAESDRATALALERYRRGLVDIVTWLEARRRAFDAKSTLIAVSNRRLQNRIALHLALAGDFRSGQPALARAPGPGS